MFNFKKTWSYCCNLKIEESFWVIDDIYQSAKKLSQKKFGADQKKETTF